MKKTLIIIRNSLALFVLILVVMSVALFNSGYFNSKNHHQMFEYELI
jgi:hypothetical protein